MGVSALDRIYDRYFVHDPADATIVADVGWVDMCNVRKIRIRALAAVLTGAGVTVFKILGNPASDGSGSDVILKTHALGTAPDAAGDVVTLELDENEVNALSQNGVRYVSANVDCANAADVIVFAYLMEMDETKTTYNDDVIA